MINNKNSQSGRSMVEMLGVLAIIGVLSVGGIAGYTTAMNKHRANEILNAASVRAMVVSAKLQQNSTADITNALAEFGNETIAGAVFGAAESVGTSQFKIKFTTAPTKTICDQMKAIVGDNGIIKDWGTDCDALTYNNDLGSGTSGDTPADEYIQSNYICDNGVLKMIGEEAGFNNCIGPCKVTEIGKQKCKDYNIYECDEVIGFYIGTGNLCYGECSSEGAKSCDGNIVMVCNNGMLEEEKSCAGVFDSCVNGTCVKRFEGYENESRCLEGNIYTPTDEMDGYYALTTTCQFGCYNKDDSAYCKECSQDSDCGENKICTPLIGKCEDATTAYCLNHDDCTYLNGPFSTYESANTACQNIGKKLISMADVGCSASNMYAKCYDKTTWFSDANGDYHHESDILWSGDVMGSIGALCKP